MIGILPALPVVVSSRQDARPDAVAYQQYSYSYVFAPQTASKRSRSGAGFLYGALMPSEPGILWSGLCQHFRSWFQAARMLELMPSHTNSVRMHLFSLHKLDHSAFASASPSNHAHWRTGHYVAGALPALLVVVPSRHDARTDAAAYQRCSYASAFRSINRATPSRIGVGFLYGALSNLSFCGRGSASTSGCGFETPGCSNRRHRIPTLFVDIFFSLHKPRHSALASAPASYEVYRRTGHSVVGALPALPAVVLSPHDARTDAVAYQLCSYASVFARQTVSERSRIGAGFLFGVFMNWASCGRGTASTSGRGFKPPRCSNQRSRKPTVFICICFRSTNRATLFSHRRRLPIRRIEKPGIL